MLDAKEAKERLMEGNSRYLEARTGLGDISPALRIKTAEYGQHQNFLVGLFQRLQASHGRIGQVSGNGDLLRVILCKGSRVIQGLYSFLLAIPGEICIFRNLT